MAGLQVSQCFGCYTLSQVFSFDLVQEWNPRPDLLYTSCVLTVHQQSWSVNCHIIDRNLLQLVLALSLRFHVQEHRVCVGAHRSHVHKVVRFQRQSELGALHDECFIDVDKGLFAVFGLRAEKVEHGVDLRVFECLGESDGVDDLGTHDETDVRVGGECVECGSEGADDQVDGVPECVGEELFGDLGADGTASTEDESREASGCGLNVG